MTNRPPAKFSHGTLVATPGARDAIAAAGQSYTAFLARHISGDWGDVPPEDKRSNDMALQTDDRILSAYTTAKGTKIWVLTEQDRSVTTLLLPSEY